MVGADPRSDVAVLKIDAKGLPTLKLGDSDKLKVGVGAGHRFAVRLRPLGDCRIVSAKGRSLPNENYVPFIQTDVAINPGNSVVRC
ncbi:S1C family serine protease [Pseudomonas denitrificans (nom. rej.)]|uniref:S1C family serine protease n=1 Tax=Pseudomonas denitrificans TaxID=43306 RepID=UPI001E3E960C|nr:trypsin-like peptidase domain-containing protein [Pseudomonas denitrificans (nom. rej.)]